MTMVAGALMVAAAWIAGAAGLPAPYWPVVTVLPDLLAVLLIMMAWRFRRSRLAVATTIVAVTNILLRGPLAADLTGLAGPGLPLLGLLLPVNLGVLAVVRDQPVQRVSSLLHLAAIVAQPWLVAAMIRVAAAGPPTAARAPWLELLGSPHAALLAFLMATVLTGLAFAVRRTSFEVALVWVLVAAALAVLGRGDPQARSLLLAAGQLALLAAAIEDSYRLAYHDQLTGLPGRRALDETLERLDGSYVIAMVDVDHFKSFNDRFGHDVGDQALRMVADELAGVEDGGRAFRYGGEEFAVVFASRTPAQAADPLEQLRAAIAGRTFSIRSPKRPRKKPEQPAKRSSPTESVTLTVSIGAAGPGPRRPKAVDVLRAADASLYKAKRRGRNRVVIDGVRAKSQKKASR